MSPISTIIAAIFQESGNTLHLVFSVTRDLTVEFIEEAMKTHKVPRIDEMRLYFQSGSL